MEIGVGLPTTVAGGGGRMLVDWARLAEERGFSTLGALDRLVYDGQEPVAALAAAAAATRRIRLATTVLVSPYRGDTAVLAKQLATVDDLSEGRLTVGVAAGNREDDFAASGAAFRSRGRRLDEQVRHLQEVWGGTTGIGPALPAGRPRLLVGGHSEAALRRAARLGCGWIAGAGSATPVTERLRRARSAWSAAGRAGRPVIVALAYYCLGAAAREHAESYLGRYYGFLGSRAVERVIAGALTDEGSLRAAVEDHASAGCDELLLFPCAADPAQVDLLAKAVL